MSRRSGPPERPGSLAGLLAAAALIMTFPAPVLADDFEPETTERRNVTGMIVFRIPFGGPQRKKSAPEIGFDLTIADPELKDYEQRRFVRGSDRWRPRLDLDRVQTWPLDSGEVPSDAPAEPARHR